MSRLPLSCLFAAADAHAACAADAIAGYWRSEHSAALVEIRKRYDGNVRLVDDNQLKRRGSIGVAPIGRTTTGRRVTDPRG